MTLRFWRRRTLAARINDHYFVCWPLIPFPRKRVP